MTENHFAESAYFWGYCHQRLEFFPQVHAARYFSIPNVPKVHVCAINSDISPIFRVSQFLFSALPSSIFPRKTKHNHKVNILLIYVIPGLILIQSHITSGRPPLLCYRMTQSWCRSAKLIVVRVSLFFECSVLIWLNAMQCGSSHRLARQKHVQLSTLFQLIFLASNWLYSLLCHTRLEGYGRTHHTQNLVQRNGLPPLLLPPRWKGLFFFFSSSKAGRGCSNYNNDNNYYYEGFLSFDRRSNAGRALS